MKLLVTGAAGFLGAALVERLLARGYTGIRCNVRRRASIPKLDEISKRFPEARLEYCVGNLKSEADACRAVDGAQLIFHLAAGLRGDAADLFLDSVVASRNLLEASGDRQPMRIVLVSSFGVYGVATLGRRALVNEQTALESHPEWRDDYSHSKLRQEQLFWEYQRRSGFELVVLRPRRNLRTWRRSFFQPRRHNDRGRQLYLGGGNLLPLTYVQNCAEAVVTAGTHPHAAGQIYNVLDDDPPTCREYLRAYNKHVRRFGPFHCLTSRLVCSPGRLSAIIDIRRGSCPRFSLHIRWRASGQETGLTIPSCIRSAGTNWCRPPKL